MRKNREKKKSWQAGKKLFCLVGLLLCLFGIGSMVIYAAETAKFGVIQTLSIDVDGSGSSYLKYESPISGKEFRVSLHKTSTDLMAYCLERTKSSDYDDYNYNYSEVKNYSEKASDLQRNILLCGYPGNSVSQLKTMYGYDTDAQCAAQATQMAIWICNYMYNKNVTMSEAWSAHKAQNTGVYDAVGLSKAILSRAYDMLNQKLTLSYENKGESGDMVTYDFLIETEGQYYPLEGNLSGLPTGCEVAVGENVAYQLDGTLQVSMVEGKTTISLTFSKYVDATKVELKLKGTVPVPKDYAGILYYENSDSSYQSVVVVKEAEPTYEEESCSFQRNADLQMRIRVKKQDSSGMEEQGDATLVGAQYTIYDSSGIQKEILTIGEEKEAISGNLPLGVYTVKETKSPVGYNIDPTIYTVDGTKGNSNVAIQTYEVVSKEKVIEGKIRILKTLENPESGSEQEIPAEGVVFTYYLNSNPKKKMEIVLDEDGVGESDWMPYGTYTLEETKTPAGWKAVPPNQVTIKEEGEILPYYMEDPVDASLCKIIKRDRETGKTIAFAGTTFQIRKKETGDIIAMYVENSQGEKERITEFVTNEEGYLVLPEQLQAGTYLLYELIAPKGYVRKEEPVEFQVPYFNEEPVEVIMENVPAKCSLQIKKTGLTFTDKEVTFLEGYEVTMPKWQLMPLQGVEYCLRAKEDIVTADQTIRMKKGEEILATTDEEGIALFEGLYPGLYELIEKKTQDGYVLDEEPKEICLEAGEENQEIFLTEREYENAPQQLKLLLEKRMEIGKEQQEEKQDAWKEVLFGLFTKEPLKNQEGEILIDADTLLDLYKIDETGQGISLLSSELPYGKYYIKELRTHSDYVLDENIYDFSFYYKEEAGKEQEIAFLEEPLYNYLKPEEPSEEENTTQPPEEETTTQKPEETETVQETTKVEMEKKAPKTGDDRTLSLWILLMVSSGLMLLTAGILQRKKRRKKK